MERNHYCVIFFHSFIFFIKMLQYQFRSFFEIWLMFPSMNNNNNDNSLTKDDMTLIVVLSVHNIISSSLNLKREISTSRSTIRCCHISAHDLWGFAWNSESFGHDPYSMVINNIAIDIAYLWIYCYCVPVRTRARLLGTMNSRATRVPWKHRARFLRVPVAYAFGRNREFVGFVGFLPWEMIYTTARRKRGRVRSRNAPEKSNIVTVVITHYA